MVVAMISWPLPVGTRAEPGCVRDPEREANMLPDRLQGIDAVELGCGAAYVSAWLARRGASPVVSTRHSGSCKLPDNSSTRSGFDFPLVQAAGEQVPLRDGSFDFAISVFLTTSTLLVLCLPDGDDLQLPIS